MPFQVTFDHMLNQTKVGSGIGCQFLKVRTGTDAGRIGKWTSSSRETHICELYDERGEFMAHPRDTEAANEWEVIDLEVARFKRSGTFTWFFAA